MMKDKTASRIRSIVAHVVLIILSFMCLFFFYVLIVNASHSHAELQKGFSARVRMQCSIMYIFFLTDSIWSLCL